MCIHTWSIISNPDACACAQAKRRDSLTAFTSAGTAACTLPRPTASSLPPSLARSLARSFAISLAISLSLSHVADSAAVQTERLHDAERIGGQCSGGRQPEGVSE
eukprot:GHVU01161044.1.p2 GENE.GHVU01161044.1~~GHVU01161044.1.p2  ORF type:complete len:105 (+),score=10.09 GHVU01161044.1:747-1061(+)